MAEGISKREQVKNMIAEAIHTKAAIATALGMSPASVSSQMTYLRWMGNNIIYNAEKVLSLATDEEFTTWKETIAAKPKKAVAVKPVADQLKAANKALKGANTALVNWNARIEKATAENTENFEEFTAEAGANLVLLTIKIKRTTAKIEALEIEVENAPEEVTMEDEDVTEIDDDELL